MSETRLSRWLREPGMMSELKEELLLLEEGSDEVQERFGRDLAFGTGGLRGILGAGTNRMNYYTVRRTTQGIANYLRKTGVARPAVAVGYDSRRNSSFFAETVADNLQENGITVYLFDTLFPVPALSFAVRHHGCQMGVMITASHNPAEYNGYKVYSPEGNQLTGEVAEALLKEIDQVDLFDGPFGVPEFASKENMPPVVHLGEATKKAYLEEVYKSGIDCGKDALADLSLVYTPLNGTGNLPVREVFRHLGVGQVTVVKEQELPDGDFPTCPYPNPEKPEALRLGISYCHKISRQAESDESCRKPDFLIGTDPDCDRVGVVVKKKHLTGDELGILLFDYICERRTALGTMPPAPVLISTVVSTEVVDAIAKEYGVTVLRTLTGFKYIGEHIAQMEAEGKEDNFIFGFEESCGYLSGTYARDKDGVAAAMLTCQMVAHLKKQGKTPQERLEEIYKKYGYTKTRVLDVTLKGENGLRQIGELMEGLRHNPESVLVGKKVIERIDYDKQEKYVMAGGSCSAAAGTRPTGLPRENVIAYRLEDQSGFLVRPSGTEPKLKFYLRGKGRTEAEAEAMVDALKVALGENWFSSVFSQEGN